MRMTNKDHAPAWRREILVSEPSLTAMPVRCVALPEAEPLAQETNMGTIAWPTWFTKLLSIPTTEEQILRHASAIL